MSYADANYNVTREVHINNLTGIASTSMVKVLTYQKRKLRGIVSQVVTAGTNASAGVDIYVGTTSVGAITHGTSTAGTNQTSGELNITCNQGDVVELKGKANSATMVNSYTAVFEIIHDSNPTF